MVILPPPLATAIKGGRVGLLTPRGPMGQGGIFSHRYLICIEVCHPCHTDTTHEKKTCVISCYHTQKTRIPTQSKRLPTGSTPPVTGTLFTDIKL